MKLDYLAMVVFGVICGLLGYHIRGSEELASLKQNQQAGNSMPPQAGGGVP
jgi:hypothetical protein